MQGIKGYSSKAINKIIRNRGKLWQQGYRDFVMDDLRAIYRKLIYIENNPVRAGLVKNPIDYRFSSAGKNNQLDLEYLS
jgi:hypothetical protein